MPNCSVVFASLGERHEVVARPRCFIAIKLNVHLTEVGFQFNIALLFLSEALYCQH